MPSSQSMKIFRNCSLAALIYSTKTTPKIDSHAEERAIKCTRMFSFPLQPDSDKNWYFNIHSRVVQPDKPSQDLPAISRASAYSFGCSSSNRNDSEQVLQNLANSAIILTVLTLVLMPICFGIFLELSRRTRKPGVPDPDEPPAANKTKPVDFARLLLHSRWLLTPFYMGLVVTVGIYMYKFARKLAKLVGEFHLLSDQELMLRVLYLLDIVMVANLLMYTAIGSFAYFVRQFHFKTGEEQPGMLGHLDGTTLKMKLGMALIGVSSIHLLEAFMDSANVSTEHMVKLIAIHLVFVVSTLSIAWIRTLPSSGKHSDHQH